MQVGDIVKVIDNLNEDEDLDKTSGCIGKIISINCSEYPYGVILDYMDSLSLRDDLFVTRDKLRCIEYREDELSVIKVNTADDFNKYELKRI